MSEGGLITVTFETILWTPVAHALPEPDEDVLMAWDQNTLASDDVHTPFQPERGWLDADGWHLAESGGLTHTAPTWWAAWPSGPRQQSPNTGNPTQQG